MADTLLMVIGTIVVALVSGGVSALVARTNAKASRTTATLPPYEQLAKRVTDLEKADETKGMVIEQLKGRLTLVMSDRDSLVSYVKELARWALTGAAPPPPLVPTHLRELLDSDEWEVSRHETTTTMRRVQPWHDVTADAEQEEEEP